MHQKKEEGGWGERETLTQKKTHLGTFWHDVMLQRVNKCLLTGKPLHHNVFSRHVNNKKIPGKLISSIKCVLAFKTVIIPLANKCVLAKLQTTTRLC